MMFRLLGVASSPHPHKEPLPRSQLPWLNLTYHGCHPPHKVSGKLPMESGTLSSSRFGEHRDNHPHSNAHGYDADHVVLVQRHTSWRRRSS